MVELGILTFKNFKSTAGKQTTIDLSKLDGLTRIVGRNGSGKTSFISVIVFVLFGKNSDLKGSGKSHLPTNELINDINNKDLMTSIEVKNGADIYKIERGLKPTVLNIYKNGEDVNKLSSVKLDQDYINKTILNGITFEMFSSIVYLSAKATSQPFFNLTSMQRKQFIEELLDVRLLHFIGAVVKKKRSTLNVNIKYAEDKLANQIKTEESIIRSNENQKALNEIALKEYEKLSSEADGRVAEVKVLIDSINNDISAGTDKDIQLLEALEVAKDELVKLDSSLEVIETAKKQRSTKQTSLDNIKREITQNKAVYDGNKEVYSKFEVCGDCPTVKELAGDYDFKEYEDTYLPTAKEQYIKTKEEIDKLDLDIDEMKKIYDKSSAPKIEKIQSITSDKAKLRSWLDEKRHEVDKYNNEIDVIQQRLQHKPNLEIDLSALISTKEQLKKYELEYEQYINELNEFDDINKLINSETIRKSLYDVYIPVLKKYIKEFVTKFTEFDDAFFEISIDDEFNITLLKNRKKSSIFKLSEGQKGSINLAFMFAFQKLIELKGQINFLVIDEILDSAFDKERLDTILQTLYDMARTKNIAIISHNPTLNPEYFDNSIEVEMTRLVSTYTGQGVS